MTARLMSAVTWPTATQIDWYQFSLQYDLIEAINGFNSAGKTASDHFQIFYADGLARPDTTLSVFNSAGQLILISRDGGVTTSQPPPNDGSGLTDLWSGSSGPLDPYLGSVQLPSATPAGSAFTYYVAVSSNEELPTAVSATFGINGGTLGLPTASNLTRLEPVDSVKRIVEDHIGFTGFVSGDLQNHVIVRPSTPAILPIATTADVANNVVPSTLSDVTLFTSDAGSFNSTDAFSGTQNYNITNSLPYNGAGNSIKMRSDGTLWEYYGTPGTANTVGAIVQIDPGTGAVLTTLGNDNIPNVSVPLPNPLNIEQYDGSVDAFAWGPWTQTLPPVFGGSHYELFEAVGEGFGDFGPESSSRLYFANPTNASAATATNTPWGYIGNITGPGVFGFTKGLEFVGNTLYGVSNAGQFFSVDQNTGRASLIADFSNMTAGFTGLTLGPQNLLNTGSDQPNGSLQNVLFASTAEGTLFAINPTNGALESVFSTGTQTQGGIPATGIAFSPLDFNLWHPTNMQATAAGHGILPAPDNSRQLTIVTTMGSNVDQCASDTSSGSMSYYFGLEQYNPNINTGSQNYITYDDASVLTSMASLAYKPTTTWASRSNRSSPRTTCKAGWETITICPAVRRAA